MFWKSLVIVNIFLKLDCRVNPTAKHPTMPEQFVLERRIGSTLYKVNVCFNEASRETLEEKVLRLMKNDLQCMLRNAIIEPLQAGWLSGRGSV